MGNHTPNGGTLKEYRTEILLHMTYLREGMKGIKSDIGFVKTDIKAVREKDIPDIRVAMAEISTELKIKASVYGIMGGFIPSLGMLIYFLINRQ